MTKRPLQASSDLSLLYLPGSPHPAARCAIIIALRPPNQKQCKKNFLLKQSPARIHSFHADNNNIVFICGRCKCKVSGGKERTEKLGRTAVFDSILAADDLQRTFDERACPLVLSE